LTRYVDLDVAGDVDSIVGVDVVRACAAGIAVQADVAMCVDVNEGVKVHVGRSCQRISSRSTTTSTLTYVATSRFMTLAG
jgi:argonaute-like protein implicated in RNA metabolism and viral defense